MGHRKNIGKHFYTNGLEEKILFDTDEVPEGWYRGRKKNLMKNTTKGNIFINNGVIQKTIPQNQPIPEGWTKGKLPMSQLQRDAISKCRKGKKPSEETKQKIRENHQTEEYRNKQKQVWLEKYGVANPMQNLEIRKKQQSTCLKKYGVENAAQADDIKEKKKQKSLEKYGVDHPMKLKEVQEKGKQTCLEKYNVEYPLQLPQAKENYQIAMINREPFTLTEQALQKQRATTQERYGVDYALQNPEVLQKQINTNLERYGVMYTLQLPQANNYSCNSKPNQHFANLLSMSNIQYTREFPIGKYKFDFQVHDTLIEINPFATHNSLWGIYDNKGIDKDYHKNKSRCAEQQGYRVIHIFDWDDEEKIINMFVNKEKIYGRKCEIKEIQIKECNDFLNQYHIQNSCKGQKICLGLFYNDKIVSVMTFGKPRYNKNYEWELLRYCSNAIVIGGAEKLFNYFIKQYNPKSVISYCDRSKFRGTVYEKLGFKLKTEGNPTKHWYNPNKKDHVTNNLLLSLGFDNIFKTNYGKGTNNEELIIQEGYVPIYDCGQDTYVYKQEVKERIKHSAYTSFE